MSSQGSKKAVIFALTGNLLIALIKYIVAFITTSTAMLAEAIHSTADSLNQVFLLVGHRRSLRPGSEIYNLGNANEIYFWAMMVAVLLFFVGAAFSIYEGVHKLMHPEEIKNAIWIFVVIISSIVIEAKSFQVAFREFRKTTGLPFFKAIRNSTQVSLIVVVLEDSAALVGLIIVLISTTLALFVHPLFDAVGSIFVGLVLLYVSIVLMSEIRNFIIGESMPRDKKEKIRKVLHSYRDIDHINSFKSILMGDNKYLVLISIDVNDNLRAHHVEDMIEQIKINILKQVPEAGIIYIDLKDADRNQKA